MPTAFNRIGFFTFIEVGWLSKRGMETCINLARSTAPSHVSQQCSNSHWGLVHSRASLHVDVKFKHELIYNHHGILCMLEV